MMLKCTMQRLNIALVLVVVGLTGFLPSTSVHAASEIDLNNCWTLVLGKWTDPVLQRMSQCINTTALNASIDDVGDRYGYWNNIWIRIRTNNEIDLALDDGGFDWQFRGYWHSLQDIIKLAAQDIDAFWS